MLLLMLASLGGNHPNLVTIIMAVGTRSMGLLMAVAAGAVQDGVWYDVDRTLGNNHSSRDVFVLSVSGTTPTVTIEGRNHPSDTPVQLTTQGATPGTGSTLVTDHYRQYRARITAGTGVNAQVSVNRSLVATA